MPTLSGMGECAFHVSFAFFVCQIGLLFYGAYISPDGARKEINRGHSPF